MLKLICLHFFSLFLLVPQELNYLNTPKSDGRRQGTPQVPSVSGTKLFLANIQSLNGGLILFWCNWWSLMMLSNRESPFPGGYESYVIMTFMI